MENLLILEINISHGDLNFGFILFCKLFLRGKTKVLQSIFGVFCFIFFSINTIYIIFPLYSPGLNRNCKVSSI